MSRDTAWVCSALHHKNQAHDTGDDTGTSGMPRQADGCSCRYRRNAWPRCTARRTVSMLAFRTKKPTINALADTAVVATKTA